MLAVIASLVLVAGTDVATAAGTPPRPHRIIFQEWLYPGAPGSPTCLAPREFADGRVRHGVLKPEYMDVNNLGRLYMRRASRRPDACNGYSPRNAAEVRKWSARQFMTISLSTLQQEEALTSHPARPVFRTCGSLGPLRCGGLVAGGRGGSLLACETRCAVRCRVGGEAARGVAGGGRFLLAAADP